MRWVTHFSVRGARGGKQSAVRQKQKATQGTLHVIASTFAFVGRGTNETSIKLFLIADRQGWMGWDMGGSNFPLMQHAHTSDLLPSTPPN